MTVSATIIKEFFFVKSYVEKFKCKDAEVCSGFQVLNWLSSIRIMKCPPNHIPQEDKKP